MVRDTPILRGAAASGIAGVLGALALLSVLVMAAMPDTAAAFPEPGLDKVYASCGGQCHDAPYQVADCVGCHTPNPDNNADGKDQFPFTGPYAQRGPHGAYNRGTDRCQMCHTMHKAPTGFKLLPGETVKATCFTCHDGSGGFGVYGAIAARGLPVGGGHSVEATNVVPGGSASTGGTATIAFHGPAGTMTCTDCHSPHDSKTVAPFVGERMRVRADTRPAYSAKLLRQSPTGATTPTPVYGSDWCLACHDGRGNGGMTLNHPVDARATNASAYYYNYLAVYSGGVNMAAYESNVPVRTQSVLMGAVGNLLVKSERHPSTTSTWFPEAFAYNSPWLMAYPRSALHTGHAPICQQCHEDARDCGELSADGTAAIVIREMVDGADADGRNIATNQYDPTNPRFQNFPHETQNAGMLVETGDDLCTNCHPPVVLP